MIAASQGESSAAHDAYRRAVVVSNPMLLAIAATIANPRFPGAIVSLDDSATEIYAIAPTHLVWRRLAPLLEARIGYELSDFPNIVNEGAAPHPLTAALGGYAVALWCRIRLPLDKTLRKAAIVGCDRLIQNVEKNAPLLDPPIRMPSTGELVIDFDGAIVQGNFVAAERVLDALRDRKLLDGLNLRCLKLRMLESRGPSTSRDMAELVAQLRGLALPRDVQAIVDRVSGEAPPR